MIRRLILAPAGACLSLSAAGSLAGCSDDTQKFQPLPGNRDDPKAQRDIEIPPGIPRTEESPKAKGKGR